MKEVSRKGSLDSWSVNSSRPFDFFGIIFRFFLFWTSRSFSHSSSLSPNRKRNIRRLFSHTHVRSCRLEIIFYEKKASMHLFWLISFSYDSMTLFDCLPLSRRKGKTKTIHRRNQTTAYRLFREIHFRILKSLKNAFVKYFRTLENYFLEISKILKTSKFQES